MSNKGLLSLFVEEGVDFLSAEQLQEINRQIKSVNPDADSADNDKLKILAVKCAEVFAHDLPKTILLFSSAIMLDFLFFKGLTAIILVEYILYGLIKPYIGGIHMKPALCAAFGLLTFYGGYFFSVSEVSPIIRLSMFSVSLIMLILYAPRGIDAAPVMPENKLALRKKALILVLSIYAFSMVIRNMPFGMAAPIANAALWAIFIQALTVTPVLFNIFEREYAFSVVNTEKIGELQENIKNVKSMIANIYYSISSKIYLLISNVSSGKNKMVLARIAFLVIIASLVTISLTTPAMANDATALLAEVKSRCFDLIWFDKEKITKKNNLRSYI